MVTATTDVASSIAPAPTAESFSFRQAREIIADLFEHRADLYWADLLLTLTIGYGAAAFFIHSHTFSLAVVACYFVAGFALFRVGSFIHEITHLHGGELTRFTIGWNLLCGIPMLMPSFFYSNHIDHHNTHRYGTIRDGEYLPLGAGSRWQLVWFWLQVPLLPLYIFFRLLIITPLSFLFPRLRQWALEHTSSFVINFRHKLDVPESAPRRAWAWLEAACCLRAAALVAVLLLGLQPWSHAVKLYLLALMTLGLNYVRNMAAHHYRNTGGEMSYLQQLEDSVNITGHPVLTELFFPLGLRYHALHHLFPALPYHNLGTAHRRLMAQLPANSPYRQTVYSSCWSVLRELWSDAARAARSAKAAA